MRSSFLFTSRVLLLTGGLAFFFGSLLIVARVDISEFLRVSDPLVLAYSAILLLGGVAALLMYYLRGGRLVPTLDERSEAQTAERIQDEMLARLQELEARIVESIRSDAASRERETLGLTTDDRSQIVQAITKRIDTDLTQEFVEGLESKYGGRILQDKHLQNVRDQCQRTKARLQSELSALSRRGNVNLVIGSITTLLAVGLLGYIVLNAGLQHPEMAVLAAHYVPRLSLIVFIEIFSFFFLRLYRTSLAEIKYFQNELTNIEAKFIALDSALAANDQDSAKVVLLELAKTERNFILDKGQSTVELQHHKIESRTIKDVLDSVGDVVKKLRG